MRKNTSKVSRKVKPENSKVLVLFGSVKPRQKPEDFKKLREEFEQGVADEVMKEMRQE